MTEICEERTEIPVGSTQFLERTNKEFELSKEE